MKSEIAKSAEKSAPSPTLQKQTISSPGAHGYSMTGIPSVSSFSKFKGDVVRKSADYREQKGGDHDTLPLKYQDFTLNNSRMKLHEN
jgi:hypothetical protein